MICVGGEKITIQSPTFDPRTPVGLLVEAPDGQWYIPWSEIRAMHFPVRSVFDEKSA